VRRVPVAIGALGLSVVVGAVSLAVGRDEPTYSFAGASTAGRVALVAAGWALALVGVAFWVGRQAGGFGLLLAAGGTGWLLAEWSNPGASSAFVYTTGLVLSASALPLVAQAALAFPGSRLASPLDRTAVAAAYAGAVVVLGLAPALLFDARSHDCGDCPRNLLALADRGEAADELGQIGIRWSAVAACVLALLLVARLVRSSPAARRSAWAVLVPAAVYCTAAGAVFAASSSHAFLWNGTTERRLWFVQAYALVGIAAGVCWSAYLAQRRRLAVARLVVELAGSPPPGGLRAAFARLVGDPGLVLGYPVGEAGDLVDVAGAPVDLGPEQQQTRLVGDGRLLAVVGHRPGLLAGDDLVDEVTATARLALENERLQARVQVRLAELRRSRSRIVAAGDAERRRLERDLHDGAQQRIVGLALSLRLASSRLVPTIDPAAAAELAAAEADVREATKELRTLAHGIFPAVLADGGLDAALTAIAEEARVPVRVEGRSSGRYSPAVEGAAYAVVAEAVGAADSGVTVRVARAEPALVVEVELAGVDGELDRTELEDRVAAADGQLIFGGRNGGVEIRVVFPCAS